MKMDILHFLYETAAGSLLLHPLTSRTISKLCGEWMDSPLSACLIRPFVKKYDIDLSEYEMEGVRSFNDFFGRKIRSGSRPVDTDPDHLIAPCDGLLSIRKIQKDMVFTVKQSRFTIGSLLRDRKLAKRYEGGLCLIFRLCVNHYHRYVYADSGRKSSNRHIDGRYHTVRPVALAHRPVFTENAREYTVIRSETFGPVVQMEVGAMLVGRICNYHGSRQVRRGEEKGRFEYGGSTIILLIEKGKLTLTDKIRMSLDTENEIPVLMGQMIGESREPSP